MLRSPPKASQFKGQLRRVLKATGLVFLFQWDAGFASAQAVYCTNCSSELTQLQNYLQLVSTLAKQAALLEQAITQTSLMAQNTAPLSKPQYGSGQADLQALQNLVAQANALSYASANLDATVNARFQTYQTYTSSPLNSTGFAAKYQQWSQD